jgi:hypothetical protein
MRGQFGGRGGMGGADLGHAFTTGASQELYQMTGRTPGLSSGGGNNNDKKAAEKEERRKAREAAEERYKKAEEAREADQKAYEAKLRNSEKKHMRQIRQEQLAKLAAMTPKEREELRAQLAADLAAADADFDAAE